MSDSQKRDGWLAFRSRDFRFFYGARFFSALSAMMIDVGLGWMVYTRTNSVWALGLVGLFAFLPNILFILAVGHVADRYDRRRVLMGCYATNTLASAGLIWCALTPTIDLAVIYGLILLFGTARAFANPASQALLPMIVTREAFPSALAWNSSSWQIASISGPAIAGLAYAVGPELVFSLTTLFYIGCVAQIFALKPRLAAAPREPVTWTTLTAGWRFIWSKPAILGSISVDLFAVLLGGATALLPVYAKDIFHIDAMGLGILSCMPAVGALACTLIIARIGVGGRCGYKMFGAVAIFGLATIGFGLSTNAYVAGFFLIITGAADMVSVQIRQTLVQLETPDAMRGRVSAVNTIFIGASNELGAFESGALASVAGPVAAVVLGGVGSVAIAALWSRLFPSLRDRDRLV
jgi:MFS family permease